MIGDMGYEMEKVSKQHLWDFTKEISMSWERCKDSGLTPQTQPKMDIVPEHQFNEITKKYQTLIDCAFPYMRTIKNLIPYNNSMVLLCNKDGVILHRLGEVLQLIKLGMEKGYIVKESSIGTNCLGTCIAANKPIAVFGDQHFFTALKDWSGVAAPIHDRDGEVIGALGIYVEKENAGYGMLKLTILAVTGIEEQINLKDRYAELEACNNRLLEFNGDIVSTASMLSHEIRNSLSTISAYVQLLQLEKVLDTLKADKILTEVTRVNKILNDFKSLTRPTQLKIMRYSLNELLFYVVDLMLAKARIAKVDIRLQTPDNDVFAYVDKDAIQQVFINLIENALQAMEKGGVLTIRLLKDEPLSMALIEFEDTGIGIPEQHLSDIFKLFYTTKKGGSGLGLTLCKNIIKNHNGDIRVQSKVGVGTKFIVQLPCEK